MHTQKRRVSALILAIALSIASIPLVAYAAEDLTAGSIDVSQEKTPDQGENVSTDASDGEGNGDSEAASPAVKEALKAYEVGRDKNAEAVKKETQAKIKAAEKAQAEAKAKAKAEAEAKAKAAAEAELERKYSKVLSYDRKTLLNVIGTQEKTGHTICCPSFSCAYADCIIDGTVRDHSYYTCSCCTWPDWGGGGSWNRCVGSSEQLLREAHDQIAKGKPTVIHVTAGSGEHWIVLFGYKKAVDPDHLTLDNFVALDPWDGVELIASERYSLYGDGCEHISTR